MILICEPHFDDAIYSCPELLVPGTVIITFQKPDDRNSKCYEKIGVKGINMPISEIGSGHAGSFKDNPDLWKHQVMACAFQLTTHSPEIFYQADRCSKVYIPFGIKHPHHIIVAGFLRGLLPHAIEYLDRPYYDVCEPDLYSHPLGKITIVETPDIDRRKLITDVFGARHVVRYSELIKDSRYL
jgi:hypothetical protein